MKMKLVTGIVVLAAIALISGATILAMAAPGTQEDPFITLSYLTNQFKPQIMNEVKSAEQRLLSTFDDKITQLEARIQANQGGTAAAPTSAETFVVVTLNRGQSLTCSVGTEIMLRIGSANGFGADPALVNSTSGSTLSAGAALTENNMYLITIEGNGVRATADMVRLLVRGSYKIS
jgi:hypothetical protein